MDKVQTLLILFHWLVFILSKLDFYTLYDFDSQAWQKYKQIGNLEQKNTSWTSLFFLHSSVSGKEIISNSKAFKNLMINFCYQVWADNCIMIYVNVLLCIYHDNHVLGSPLSQQCCIRAGLHPPTALHFLAIGTTKHPLAGPSPGHSTQGSPLQPTLAVKVQISGHNIAMIHPWF